MIRSLRKVGWTGQLRRRLGKRVSGGDHGTAGMCQTILGLFPVGRRRLRHLAFLRGDPPVRTVRFKIFNRAGRLVRAGGCNLLRLNYNEQIERRFCNIAAALSSAA